MDCAVEPPRDQDPVQGRADGESDADPDLAKAEGQNTARQAHQQPRRHVGRLRAHRRDPRTHAAPAEEIFLFARAALFEEEKGADAEHQDKIQYKCQYFAVVHDAIHSQKILALS